MKSTEPSAATSATVLPSPIAAYEPMGAKPPLRFMPGKRADAAGGRALILRGLAAEPKARVRREDTGPRGGRLRFCDNGCGTTRAFVARRADWAGISGALAAGCTFVSDESTA